MNKRLLQSKMDDYGDNYASLAKAMGRSIQTFSAKMNNKSDWIQREIMFIQDRYNLTSDDVIEIFFDKKVS